MSIIPENGRKFETDVKTVGGYRLSIITTPTGYYKIDSEGPGGKPGICDGFFTNLRDARRALERYVLDNAATFNKQAMIEKIAGPKPERNKKK